MRQSVLVCVPDLFFRAKIETTARALDIPCCFVQSVEEIPADQEFHGCLIDLEAVAPAGLEFLRGVGAERSGAARPTVGFLSHVHVELGGQASQLGCSQVLPRSRLAAEMAKVLQQLSGEASS